MWSGSGQRRGGASTWLCLLTALALVVSACGGSAGSDAGPTTLAANDSPTTTASDGDGDDGTPDPAPEETTTTRPVSNENPPWTEQELVLNTIAESDRPVALVGRSGTGDLYVANQTGTVVQVVRTTAKNQPDRFRVQDRPILDISDEISGSTEQGLLDLAFSSDGRKLFVSYTDRSGANVIDRYGMGSRGADLDSRTEVLRVDQPFANHNGGGLAFGPDGFLYVGLGDGGRAGDPLGSGQDPNSLLGSILRIDPDGAADGEGYSVPNGNPFFDGGGAPEVWITGVRNPWRFSFDKSTDALWIADVGQDRFEEVTVLPDGGFGANLGWNQMEGFEEFNGATEPDDHTPPLVAYAHDDGRCSVTGGYTYRGTVLPKFDGVYIFGDFCSGETFGVVDSEAGPIFRTLNLQLRQETLGSFGVDNDGEMYILSLDGTINRIEPTQADIDAAEAEAAEDG